MQLSDLDIDRQGGQPLHAQIVDGIARMIEDGRLEPGTRLPTVRALADEIGVNPMTVAKAYRALAEVGLTEGRGRRGTLIRRPVSHRPESVRGRFGRLDRLTEQTSREAVADRMAELARAPGVIAFTANYPGEAESDIATYRRFLAETIEDDALYVYEASGGSDSVRRQLQIFANGRGIATAGRAVVPTGGGQQALDLCARLLLRRGDTVLCEQPAYFGAVNLLRLIGCRIVGLKTGPAGIAPEDLDAAVEQHRPRLLYLNPTFQNPTGATLPLQARRDILAIARRHHLAILEDDHCPELWFDEPPPPPLAALSEPDEPVFYCAGFGKVYLPGLRLGFAVVPQTCEPDFIALKGVSDLHGPTVLEAALADYLRRADIAGYLSRLRALYRPRHARALALLDRLLPDEVRITRPGGGLNIWVELPGGIDASELYFQSVRHGVAFVDGTPFHAGRPDSASLRLSIGRMRDDRLEEGIDRLTQLVRGLLSPNPAGRPPTV